MNELFNGVIREDMRAVASAAFYRLAKIWLRLLPIGLVTKIQAEPPSDHRPFAASPKMCVRAGVPARTEFQRLASDDVGCARESRMAFVVRRIATASIGQRGLTRRMSAGM
jgi:hypothetical protein